MRERLGHLGDVARATRSRKRWPSAWPRCARGRPKTSQAQIAPFASPQVAARISGSVDDGLAAGGARDVTAAHREGGRLVTADGCTYLLPTIVRCEDASHPLANREFLFPFASVVEVKPDEIPQCLGPDAGAHRDHVRRRAILRRLHASPLIQRLNVGPIPTLQITWDQPHEGNLFDHLYVRRAYQQALA